MTTIALQVEVPIACFRDSHATLPGRGGKQISALWGEIGDRTPLGTREIYRNSDVSQGQDEGYPRP